MTALSTSAQQLRAAGLTDVERAQHLLAALPASAQQWCRWVERVADPDQALLQALRLHEAAPASLAHAIEQGGRSIERLIAVLGGSRALGDLLVTHPDMVPDVWESHDSPRYALLRAVGADPTVPMPVAQSGATFDQMRRAYRALILPIAADDLTSEDPAALMPDVGFRLSQLADAALEASLAVARRDIDPGGKVRLAVIAMGKTGAQELNYVSDVDVVYVAGPGEDPDVSERIVVEVGTRLAVMTAQGCSGAGTEPPLWTVDATLRPEGADGALVRTLDSFQSYWDKWAQTWEFQALLKARPAAGDTVLGQEFCQAADPLVWSAASLDGFVDNARAMRERVEANVPRRDVARELKLGAGGLRDVEFTVQLLQLVHGRSDESLRVKDTVHAIRALVDGGYVGRTAGAELEQCYRFLRAVEHRTQLARMRRTHLLPDNAHDMRVLARSIDATSYVSSHDFTNSLQHVRQRVRALHDDVFYRPIVAATAQLSPDEAALDRQAAMDRLKAIGYRDPAGALGHIHALTGGASRRAAIQRHLLPVFMSWLADGADPDMGMLGFRRISDAIGESHWYLALLRDSGVAASRLCQILPNSRWIADALSLMPEAIEWLDEDEQLASPQQEKLVKEVDSLLKRYADGPEAAQRVLNVRAREMTRAGMSDVLLGVEPGRRLIAQCADVALHGALSIAMREEIAAHGHQADVAIIALGRLGGEESSYASDADVMVVHQPRGNATDSQAAAAATRVANRIRALLGRATSRATLSVDMDLRPEGKAGPVSRTVASYQEYWDKWASVWERQALLRARLSVVSDGATALGDAMMDALNQVRYERPPTHADLREIRLLKARMEEERLPRGVEPRRHVKLGPGGLSDVEWVVQLLQMQHAYTYLELRTTRTMEALEAEQRLGLIGRDQAHTLKTAWTLAARIRSGNVLASGRSSGDKLDMVPRDAHDLKLLAHVLGFGHGREHDLVEDWLRAGRQARKVMDQLFWSS